MSVFRRWSQPVDATLDPKWKDEVYSIISEESRLLVSPQALLNQAVCQLNERPRKALGIEISAERFNASVASTG
jgi:IS30 family transposase